MRTYLRSFFYYWLIGYSIVLSFKTIPVLFCDTDVRVYKAVDFTEFHELQGFRLSLRVMIQVYRIAIAGSNKRVLKTNFQLTVFSLSSFLFVFKAEPPRIYVSIGD